MGFRLPATGFRLVFAVCAGVLLAASAAAAQTTEAGRLLAVQQRKYRLDHELSLGGMFAPLDAFKKGLAPEAAYTWHFDDDLSWEVLRAGYAFQLDTGLSTQLVRDFGVNPDAFESLQWYATSALIWSPLYGKFALRNAKLLHLEGYLLFGGAYGRFQGHAPGANGAIVDGGSSSRLGPEVGAGLRLFLGQRTSLRFEARDAVFVGTKGANDKLVHLDQVLFLSLGLSFALGGVDGP